MRWGWKEREIKEINRRKQRYLWDSWFAWYPIQIEKGRWVFLEFICRIRISDASRDDPLGFYWKYSHVDGLDFSLERENK